MQHVYQSSNAIDIYSHLILNCAVGELNVSS